VGVTSGVQPVAEDAVREWFEQALIESVIGVQSLRGPQEWSVEDIAKSLSQEALTTAVMAALPRRQQHPAGVGLQARIAQGAHRGVAVIAAVGRRVNEVRP
jgi:hypothetical protein